MVFRVNFLTFWIVSNVAFALVIENYATKPLTSEDGGPIIVNDGKIGFIEVFALYLAALVTYRVLFGLLHILKFKILRNCSKKYKTPKFDLHEDVKELRK